MFNITGARRDTPTLFHGEFLQLRIRVGHTADGSEIQLTSWDW